MNKVKLLKWHVQSHQYVAGGRGHHRRRSDAVSETALGGWKDWGQPNKDSVMPANAPVVSQARRFH